MPSAGERPEGQVGPMLSLELGFWLCLHAYLASLPSSLWLLGALMLPWVPTRVRKQIVGNGGRKTEAKLLVIFIAVFEVQVWSRAVCLSTFLKTRFNTSNPVCWKLEEM